MEHDDWFKLLQDVGFDLNVLADIGIDGSLRDNDTETSTNPDFNIPAEEPVDNAPESGLSQAEIPEAPNTGSDPANPNTGVSQMNFDTETSVDPDFNIPAEEPVDIAPDSGPSQAEIPEAPNTGSDQGVRTCCRKHCQNPAAVTKQCEKHRRETNERQAQV